MNEPYRKRRILVSLTLFAGLFFVIAINTPSQILQTTKTIITTDKSEPLAINALNSLLVKGRAPKNDYSRDKFSSDWAMINGCSMRNIILNRDLTDAVIDDSCNVVSGLLADPYTGKIISFKRGASTSSLVQIDHVVALADAWQKGAQNLSSEKRKEFANDPLELIAVDGAANQQKGGGDAATWLPKYKPFRCQYVARQIAVKQKYNLWVTIAEKNAIESILDNCPAQRLPSP